jgi:hypothetical protein
MQTPAMPSPTREPNRLLRYRFDSCAQARRHVHVIEGRQLLFILDPLAELRERLRMLVAFCFTESEEVATAPGEVCSIETGRLRGAWVELFPARFLEELEAALRNKPRRRNRRVPADAMIRIERPGKPAHVARLVDVSGSGARFAGAAGVWSAGEQVAIAPMGGGAPLHGRVAWSRSGEMAMEFSRSNAATRVAATKLMEGAIKRWSEAREVYHPGLCLCDRGGPVFEPLLPRAAHRRAEVV